MLNHRVVEVGRHLWVYLLQPLLQQGHAELLTQAHVQAASESLQGEKLHNLSGKPVPVLQHQLGVLWVQRCMQECLLVCLKAGPIQ